jgi:hypothetical protein
MRRKVPFLVNPGVCKFSIVSSIAKAKTSKPHGPGVCNLSRRADVSHVLILRLRLRFRLLLCLLPRRKNGRVSLALPLPSPAAPL